ncbi:M1 family metallopeptidase [candidate division KSB1 bacterium]
MRTLAVLLLVIYPILVSAQEVKLLETVNYQNAVRVGTRIRDGNPGPKYWQNHADYDISVRLDTALKQIFGRETVTYYNQSPDSLPNIVIRLYQNIYKMGAIRDIGVHPGNIHEGITLDTMIINGKGILLNKDGVISNGTNLSIPLEQAIPSMSKLILYCEWNYKIPLETEFRRTGFYKDNAWFIGYFYPQIAVYDDMEISPVMKGWDFMLFHKGMQEFYNDFNNFKVTVEVPEGFYVWATGYLTNAPEVYSKLLIERLNVACNTDKIVHIISKHDLNNNMLIGNIWKFEAKEVTDFGFGTSPGYLWDGTSVLVNNRHVFVDVAYHPESILYPQIIDIAKKTVKYTSEILPGIPFPYNHATTFNGMLKGGMEFPMIANNSDETDSTFITLMTFHEICHNYFPFMMGINEKRYHFIDEGLTEFFTLNFLWDEYKIDFHSAGSNSDKAIGIFNDYSELFFATQDNCSLFNSYAQIDENNVYYQYLVKPVVPYMLFMDMIGVDKFKFALSEFARRWKGKHPTPFDFFYTMNDVLNENFNWFWNAWFLDSGTPDLGIELKENHIIVKRMGTKALPLPIHVSIEYLNGTSLNITKSMDIWKSGEKQISIEIQDFSNVKSVSLDYESVPDIDHSNNYIEIY